MFLPKFAGMKDYVADSFDRTLSMSRPLEDLNFRIISREILSN